jgi:peptidoglycan-N-acetylglucosamine deacetylase
MSIKIETKPRRKRKLIPVILILLTITVFSGLWVQPRWLWVKVSPWLAPGAVYFVETQQPLVALTIDDGPDDIATDQPKTTELILRVLAKYHAHATFFLIGNRITPDSQPLVAAIVNQGHEVGNHLWQDQPSIELSLADFESELIRTQAKILEALESQPKSISVRWLRPGGGVANRAMIKIAQDYSYQVALGSIWPYDTLIPSTQFAANQILSNVRPGAITILHDHGDRGEWGKRTAQTLAQVLPELQRRGFKVVTLSELLAKK